MRVVGFPLLSSFVHLCVTSGPLFRVLYASCFLSVSAMTCTVYYLSFHVPLIRGLCTTFSLEVNIRCKTLWNLENNFPQTVKKNRPSSMYSSEVETLMTHCKVIVFRLMSELMGFSCFYIPSGLWNSIESYWSARCAVEVLVWIEGNIHRIPASLQLLTCSQICARVILSLPISAATLKIYVDNIKVAKGSFTGCCLSQSLAATECGHRLKSWDATAASRQKYGHRQASWSTAGFSEEETW